MEMGRWTQRSLSAVSATGHGLDVYPNEELGRTAGLESGDTLGLMENGRDVVS
jgi:hypothetical protein